MAASIRIPTGDIEGILNTLAGGLTDNPNLEAGAASNPVVQGIGSDVDFLTRLTSKNLWIRVGEFAVGAILIYVGLKAAFPSQVAAVTSVPKTAAKVGAAGAVAA